MSHSKTALVTGGTRGIGYGIAEELASVGYDLVLGYRQNQERAQDAKAHLEGTYKVRVFLVGGTTEEEATVDAYFSCIDENFGGKLNALVHNAGGYWGGHPPSKPDANGSWFQGWEAYEYYQGMYPKCFISYVSPGISKASVEYLVRHYAKQLAPRRITCNVIIPGFTKTEAWGPVLEERGADQVEGMVSSLCMKRWGSPREVGGVVAFLCSEKAAFVTGVALPVDGGLHLN
ncbi:3-oxoacyl-[acyl-carrier-protein] reductase FabG-like [Branchiostoma floridae x Branchiostoma belcheri]